MKGRWIILAAALCAGPSAYAQQDYGSQYGQPAPSYGCMSAGCAQGQQDQQQMRDWSAQQQQEQQQPGGLPSYGSLGQLAQPGPDGTYGLPSDQTDQP